MADDPSERLMRLIGDALVTWSEVENLWRSIFPRVLFLGFRHEFRKDELKYGPFREGDTARDRAMAVWDSLTSSAAQIDLLLSVAPIALSQAERQKGLARLLALAKETHKKRGLRNAVAHSGFERPIRFVRTGPEGKMTLTAGPLTLTDNAHSLIRGKDPYTEIPRIIEEFKEHREKVRWVYTWLTTGYPTDADETLMNTDQPQ
jgi:hypothetical protein